MDEIRQWFCEARADEAVRNLIKHGFDAIKVSDGSAACKEALKRIPKEKTVGVGGSVSLREIGLISKLEVQGNTLYDHWKPGLMQDESMNIRKAQQSCDIYLTSTNAITLSGEIINTDGYCNRISSMAFGPGEVIIIAGRNKIVRDLPEALNRIKSVAAPLNARRFGADTPCVKLGRCVDCDSSERICRGTLILERRPFVTKMLVMIVVQEDLGY
jgi:hypothetical protein